ncbi:hypothetical protein P3T27_004699 [Kitasatospora sp. MAA19]|nr:hypothetical protein [Kitasatospora sp. MAA19]MDH6707962.1 hypothetical protein [Kitasatospora sp. MAA19]
MRRPAVGHLVGRAWDGLVHVDFAPQRRTPKASYAWYRDLIAAHRAAHGR